MGERCIQYKNITAHNIYTIRIKRLQCHKTESKHVYYTSVYALADPRKGPGWAMPPRHVGKRPECTKSRHFQTQNRKNFLGRVNAPSKTLASFPLHESQRLFTLVLSPGAICIHTTASFPTSNGFLRLKRFKQSMEE